MGFLDQIISAAQELTREPGRTPAEGSQAPQTSQAPQANQERSVLDGLVDMFKTGGAQNILGGFTSRGLGDIINSWIGTGANRPISSEQVRTGLGADAIRQLAQRAGISEDKVMEHLRNLLPGVIDRATPRGTIEGEGGQASSGDGGNRPDRTK
jgi:uncharacterized protein YidB (DUF937 family)